VPDLQQLTFVIISGAAVGSIYGLFAISYHLMYSVRGAVSFAQGDLTMLAGFLLISLAAWLQSPVVAFLMVLVLISLASGLIERFCIRPAIKVGSHSLGWILATVGLATFMSNTSTIIWGNLPLRPPELVTLPAVKIGFATIGGSELLAISCGCAIVILLRMLLTHTIIGRSIRVTAADPMAAQLCGINSDRVSLAVFMLSGAIASVSMMLIAPLSYIRPDLGFIFGLKGFAAATFGGLDRAETAFLGGILLGIAEALAAFFLWSGLKDAVGFFAMAIIILVSPAGLFALMRRR
jgi:branched-chain amino acid transport system permease protein